MAKYTVCISGSFWSKGPVHEAATLKEAKDVILSYGDMADSGDVYKGIILVAKYTRNRSGKGPMWRKV